MTGKVIDRGATALLILILPFAFFSVLLFKAWPVLLALFIISMSWSIWQQYRWKQWSKQVNPYFNQLIKENQGCLTALDLSLKASLSGSAARWFLDKKAEEFGAQRRVYEDKGTVYYFLTASALGSIFDESEPPLELESEFFTTQEPKLSEPLLQKELIASPSEVSTSDLPEPLEPSEEKEPSLSVGTSLTGEVEADLESLEEQQDSWAQSPDQEQETSKGLIQAELAKRLDVHSSTIGKRKSDPDFSEWSQSRDPDGIAWEYAPENKEFLPVEKKPKSED
jgi:hypothetical protein